MKRVYPIRKIEQINRIRRNLKKPKTAVFYALFVIGVNTNLRVSDLLNLRWKQLWVEGTHKFRDNIFLGEKKTKKTRRIKISDNMQEALLYLLENIRPPKPTDPIFRNKKTKKVYSREYISRRMGVEGRKVGIQDPIAIHSLRKTWGYHAAVTFHQPLVLVQAAFNHASEGETMGYLSINDDDLEDVYDAVAL